jgi:hypothetical protein
MNNYLDDNAKYCCSVLSYLIEYRIRKYEDGSLALWTCEDPEQDLEPKLIDLNYCPNCGAKL